VEVVDRPVVAAVAVAAADGEPHAPKRVQPFQRVARLKRGSPPGSRIQ
jgi:hypothetical protein